MTQSALFGMDTAPTRLLPQHPGYRYDLTRWWATTDDTPGSPGTVSDQRLLWIMLNPSTATQTTDDPTISRCITYSRAWGFPGLTVVNLFALRATDPKDLDRAYDIGVDPVGPSNDLTITAHLYHAPKAVAAWGANAARFSERELRVKEILRGAPEKVHVLGLTKGGHPKHPLYLEGKLEPTPWNPA